MKLQIKKLEFALQEEKSELDSLNGQYSFIKESILKKEKQIQEIKSESQLILKAIELLQAVQKVTREATRQHFETIVSHALKSVFQKDISLKLEFGKRGNLPTLDLNVRTNNKKEHVDLLDSESGGIINIVSMALRLVLLEISIPKIQGFIILDEKFVNVSEEYLENTINFLNEINKKLQRQIIFITHNKQLTENNNINLVKI